MADAWHRYSFTKLGRQRRQYRLFLSLYSTVCFVRLTRSGRFGLRHPKTATRRATAKVHHGKQFECHCRLIWLTQRRRPETERHSPRRAPLKWVVCFAKGISVV